MIFVSFFFAISIASFEKSIPSTCFGPSFDTLCANNPVPHPTSKTDLFFQFNSLRTSLISSVGVPLATNDVKCLSSPFL